MTGEPGELAAQLAVLRDTFPGYRFRRRDLRGAPCYVAEARCSADAPLAAARSPEILADMLAAAAGRPVQLRSAAGVPRRPVGRPPRRLPHASEVR